MMGENDDCILEQELVNELAGLFPEGPSRIRNVYNDCLSPNVRVVLFRQYKARRCPSPARPVCTLLDEEAFIEVLAYSYEPENALLTLARVYDEAHVALCKARKLQPHLPGISYVDLRPLVDGLRDHTHTIDDQIILTPSDESRTLLSACWKPVVNMSFDNLPRLKSLAGTLPGEEGEAQEYAGIGGGGGSDVISASLIGQLLKRHNKKMEILVSTRTWETGSQGKDGAKAGVRREVSDHGGHIQENGQDVPGTYRIHEKTTANGRDLEAIPVKEHKEVFMVLDQNESWSSIPEKQRATLTRQFGAILAKRPIQTAIIANPSGLTSPINGSNSNIPTLTSLNSTDCSEPPSPGSDVDSNIQTVVTVDTGGDVFGANGDLSSTPDQDYRVQKAITELRPDLSLVTAVVAPGVDAPDDAPETAFQAGGMVYKLTQDDERMILEILKNWRMDGTDRNRFGKTTLALQARLRGKTGWTSLDLPKYVVDTWDNPWSSFVYIRDCMSDIVFIPTRKFLPILKKRRHSVD